MTRKITVNLPETLINAIDSVGSNDSPFNLIPNGQRPTRSSKPETLLRYAIDNPPDRDTDQPVPQPVTVQPVIPVPDAAPVNADNISTHALTRHHIYTINTADILTHILGTAAFRDPIDLKLLAGVTPQHLARRWAERQRWDEVLSLSAEVVSQRVKKRLASASRSRLGDHTR